MFTTISAPALVTGSRAFKSCPRLKQKIRWGSPRAPSVIPLDRFVHIGSQVRSGPPLFVADKRLGVRRLQALFFARVLMSG